MKLKLKLAMAALLTMGLSSAAHADTVTVSLLSTTGYAPVTGGNYSFYATAAAAPGNSGPIYLNGDSFNVTAPVTLDDSSFFNNFPLDLLPGASFTGDLFTLTVPAGSSFGNFQGTFSLLGGSTADSTDTLGTVNFSLTTTPEPSSVVLLLTGLAGIAYVGLQRRRHSWSVLNR